MKRREFITLVGGVAAWPLAVRAQQLGKVLRIGVVFGGVAATVWETALGFKQGMRDLGYVEGRDFVIEWRFAEGNYARFSDFATEFARLKVDIIVTGTGAAVAPMRRANPNTPIVMAYSTDPVGQGLVASLRHPGGNTTGLASAIDEITAKQVDLLQTVVPNLASVAFLTNPASPVGETTFQHAVAAAEQARISVLPMRVQNADDLESAFENLSKERVGAVIVTVEALFFSNRKRVADLAIAKRLPSMFGNREYAVSGGLMSYGDSIGEFLRKAATFVDKIAKGAKPGDLPVELPTKFHLVINRKTANALGLAIPPQLYIFADEVIE
jgi:putative ABC transport system substrate-binding protein